MKLRGKRKKNFRTVYNLLGYRNTAISSDIVLKLILRLDQSSIDGSLLLTLHTSHKMILCESVVGQELQNLLFLWGSSPRSLPFSYILLHNSLKQLCWIRLMALQQYRYNLNLRLVKCADVPKALQCCMSMSCSKLCPLQDIFGGDILTTKTLRFQ